MNASNSTQRGYVLINLHDAPISYCECVLTHGILSINQTQHVIHELRPLAD